MIKYFCDVCGEGFDPKVGGSGVGEEEHLRENVCDSCRKKFGNTEKKIRSEYKEKLRKLRVKFGLRRSLEVDNKPEGK